MKDEVIDLEQFSKEGKKPPAAAKYRIRIDKQQYEVAVSTMTGKQLLELAGKRPVERYMLMQRLHGGSNKRIQLNDIVDFTTPGIERFNTLPLDQTEG